MYSVEIAKSDVTRFVAIGSSCTVSIQDITPGSPANTELQFYNPAVPGWVQAPVLIPMVLSPIEADIYFFTFNATALSPNKGSQEYLVITRDGTGAMLDAMILRVGSTTTQKVERIARTIAPAGRTVSRTSDTSLQIRCFDDTALTVEKLRFSVVQDSSGNQPEETQTDVSSEII